MKDAKLTPSRGEHGSQNSETSKDEILHDLYGKYRKKIMQYFAVNRFSAQETEDLVQETFLNVFKGLEAYRSDANFETWLHEIARNVRNNELRKRTRVKRMATEVSLDDPPDELVESLESALSSRENVLGSIIQTESRKILLDAINTLPGQMRKCIYLRVVQDLKYMEIAAVLRISIQTVRSQLYEARKRLEPILQRYAGKSGLFL